MLYNTICYDQNQAFLSHHVAGTRFLVDPILSSISVSIIGVGMILKLGGLNHGEHVHSGTLSIISHFKDYVHK